ncbi:hypothetical protein ACH5RR_038930 [Cinchona calisaya]|uniref:Transposase MuDR plant domain-containing protein n=1 Tax=Cinchona calisaya TaxID=153742 RepID=A0ABD2Y029_9GENT
MRSTIHRSGKRAQDTNKPQNQNEGLHGEDYDSLMKDPPRFLLNSKYGNSDDEEFDEAPVRYISIKADVDMRNPSFELGMKFPSKQEFSKAIYNYSIINGRPTYMYTNKNIRMRAKSKDPCKWFVYAAIVPALGIKDFVVNSINGQCTN